MRRLGLLILASTALLSAQSNNGGGFNVPGHGGSSGGGVISCTPDTNLNCNITGTNLTLSWSSVLPKNRNLPSAVYNDQINTFGAGFTQVFTTSASDAGTQFVGVTSDPTNMLAGGWWYRSDSHVMGYSDGTNGHRVLDSQLLLRGIPALGHLIPTMASGQTTLGAAGTAVCSNGSDELTIVSCTGGSGASNLHQITDFLTTVPATTGAVAASTIGSYLNGNFLPAHAAASWVSTVGNNDTVWIEQRGDGSLSFGHLTGVANTYTLTGFDLALQVQTDFSDSAMPIAVCTVTGGSPGTYACVDRRPFIKQDSFVQASKGNFLVRTTAGAVQINSVHNTTINAATSYSINAQTDWANTNVFNTLTNGAATIVLAQASTPGTCGSGRCDFANGWWTLVGNVATSGVTTAVITTSTSKFYGPGQSGTLSTLTISPNQFYVIQSDGTNYLALQVYAGSGSGGSTTFDLVGTGNNTTATLQCTSSCTLTGNITANAITGVAVANLSDGSNVGLLNATQAWSSPNTFNDVVTIAKNGAGTDLLSLSNTNVGSGASQIGFANASVQAHLGIQNSGTCINQLAIISLASTLSQCFNETNGNVSLQRQTSMNAALFVEAQGSLTSSATPVFNVASGNTQYLTLTAPVTSSTFSGGTTGTRVTFFILEDATGSRTFVPPVASHGWPAITTAANEVNVISCEFRTSTDCWATSFIHYQP